MNRRNWLCLLGIGSSAAVAAAMGAFIALRAAPTGVATLLTCCLPRRACSKKSETTRSPLTRSVQNPNYFAREDGSVVVLQGSHTWNNFQDSDRGAGNFDYTAYINFLAANGHNFIRLWVWEGTHPQEDNWRPVLYARTGPGTAADGGPKYDLDQFNQAYFDRLRARVQEAGNAGIYVGIMLFQGWSMQASLNSAYWNHHWYHPNNNIQGLNGDPVIGNGMGMYTLDAPATLARQKAYINKVIQTVNDLDNVLYEIGNEHDTCSAAWQYELINHIRSVESGMPKQHPVGMTSIGTPFVVGGNDRVLASCADWLSPGREDFHSGDIAWRSDPTQATGSRVFLLDIDHIFPDPPEDIRVWNWRVFLRGYQALHMDDAFGTGIGGAWRFEDSLVRPRIHMRGSIKQINHYAHQRCDMRFTLPHSELSSTGYCIANPGKQYLILRPGPGTLTVNLSAGAGKQFSIEWLDVATDSVSHGADIAGGSGAHSFTAPFSGSAVLFLNETQAPPPPPPPLTRPH
jgi:Family of unknown function (DUF6298)